MALPIIGLLLFGLQTMGGHDVKFWPTLHASTGFLLLALVIYRLIWRFRHPPPRLPDTMPWWQRSVAMPAHIALYAAMVLLPLTGWLAYTEHVRRSIAMGMTPEPASLFWISAIPQLSDFGINFHFIHKWGGKAVLALVALHAVAALKHHFFDHDDVLRRMLPAKRVGTSK